MENGKSLGVRTTKVLHLTVTKFIVANYTEGINPHTKNEIAQSCGKLNANVAFSFTV